MGQIQRGEEPRNLDVSYIFCKQLFAPWENLDEDPVSIDLIYEQIINGILFSLFRNINYFLIGIRANIYTYSPEMDPNEFILLAVQHYYIVYGKDVELDKMKQIVQELLPAPYTTAPQNGDGKSVNKKIKPLMSEKQIDDIVRSAVQKDDDVS